MSAIYDFLFRMRRPASLVAFNDAIPNNYKLIHRPDGEWVPTDGVYIDPIANLTLKPAVLDGNGDVLEPAIVSSDRHYNIRVIPLWSGWDGLFIDESDPDYDDPTLDKSKIKQWMKNNGVMRTDDPSEHPRSGRADMRWYRWTDGVEWTDITIDEPAARRQVFL